MKFTIESTFYLPVFRQRTIDAASLYDACQQAIDDDEWGDATKDHDSSGPTFITGAWSGTDAAYSGTALTVPDEFAGDAARQAREIAVLQDALGALLDAMDPLVNARRPGTTALRGAVATARRLSAAPDRTDLFTRR